MTALSVLVIPGEWDFDSVRGKLWLAFRVDLNGETISEELWLKYTLIYMQTVANYIN